MAFTVLSMDSGESYTSDSLEEVVQLGEAYFMEYQILENGKIVPFDDVLSIKRKLKGVNVLATLIS